MTGRIVLIGLSGVGKSTAGRHIAGQLGWPLIDTDTEIERSFGQTIPEVFRDHGESSFRARESKVLLDALSRDHVVIACGGGAVLDPDVWSPDLLDREDTLVVSLDASPETSLTRLLAQKEAEGEAVERPLLAAPNPLPRIGAMKAERQARYDQADVSIITDRMPPAEIAREIIWLARLGEAPPEPALTLEVASGTSTIYVQPGCSVHIGALVRHHWPRAQHAWVITDDIVGPLHGSAIAQAIAASGLPVAAMAVPAGEASKSLEVASDLYDWLLDQNIERGDVIVALGGGVVGDLAGFVAATTLRGVGLVQVPTTVLAMVDSSVGGKTGIDHRAGKNLIGAFYQPPLVIADPSLLATLPERQIRNGWAEIIKHAIIQPSTPGGTRADLLRFLVRNERSLAKRSPAALSYLICRNIALKAAVVAADEREAGIRAYLNFGHTLGHAIEAAGYRLLHGEAISVGMRAESTIGLAMGTCTPAEAAAIDEALRRAKLPRTADADPDAVLDLLQSDKKRAAGKLRWVLPISGGGVAIRDDVPPETVRSSLLAVTDGSLV